MPIKPFSNPTTFDLIVAGISPFSDPVTFELVGDSDNPFSDPVTFELLNISVWYVYTGTSWVPAEITAMAAP